MEWTKLLATPGLIGAFIAAIVALFMSIKNHRELRCLETHKVKLSFAKEKLFVLREARKELPNVFSMDSAYEAMRDDKSESMMPFLKEVRDDYFKRSGKYEEIRYCFSGNIRDSLDKLISNIKENDFLVQSHNLNAIKKDKLKGKVPDQIHKAFSDSNSLKIEFCSKLDESIMISMDVLSDQLS